MNTAFANAFSILTLSTKGAIKVEQHKYECHVSTIMRLLASQEGYLVYNFTKVYQIWWTQNWEKKVHDWIK